MKYLLTFILFFAMVSPALASEVTGNITTGVSTSSGVNGVVIEKPSATPPAGVYTSTQNVVLSGGAGTQSIHYTSDGSAAKCSGGTVYSSPIVVSSNVIIEAVGCYANGIVSPALISAYVINPPSAPASSGGGGGGGGGGIVTTPATSAEDFNDDGKVDVFDFNTLMSNWGTTSGATSAMGDASGDGSVNIFDFNLLMAQWGA